jgi:hypothetical protein
MLASSLVKGVLPLTKVDTMDKDKKISQVLAFLLKILCGEKMSFHTHQGGHNGQRQEDVAGGIPVENFTRQCATATVFRSPKLLLPLLYFISTS